MSLRTSNSSPALPSVSNSDTFPFQCHEGCGAETRTVTGFKYGFSKVNRCSHSSRAPFRLVVNNLGIYGSGLEESHLWEAFSSPLFPDDSFSNEQERIVPRSEREQARIRIRMRPCRSEGYESLISQQRHQINFF